MQIKRLLTTGPNTNLYITIVLCGVLMNLLLNSRQYQIFLIKERNPLLVAGEQNVWWGQIKAAGRQII